MDYLAQVAVFLFIFGTLAASLNLILGFGGMFTIAQAVHFGVGAYTYSMLVTKAGWGVTPAVVAALVVGGVVVAALSAPAVRLRGDYLLIASLAVQIVLESLFENWSWATNGQLGVIGIPFYDIDALGLGRNLTYGLLCLLVAVLAVAALKLYVGSPWGRVLLAIREDEVAAVALGKRVVRTKTVAFGIAGIIAAASGILYSAFVSYIDPASFTVIQSVEILAMVLIGGRGNLYGPFVGAAIIVGLPELLRPLPFPAGVEAQLELILNGTLLAVFMVLRPQGIIPERVAARNDRKTAAAAEAAPREGEADAPERRPVVAPSGDPRDRELRGRLAIVDLSKSFGSLRVLEGVSLDVPAGRVTGIVGPNGAGKTVLLDVITAFARPNAGAVRLGDDAITRWSPGRISRAGVVRLFQEHRLFGKLSALDNVLVGCRGLAREAAVRVPDLRRRVRADQQEAARSAMDLLRMLKVDHKADTPAEALSGGQQRLVSMARALATRPSVLLLDEPCAGLAPPLVEEMKAIVRDICDSGIAVAVVEHNIEFVRETADEVVFMNAGRVVRRGAPSRIFADDELSRIYFGVHGRPHGAESNVTPGVDG